MNQQQQLADTAKPNANDVTQASGPLKRGEIPPPPGPAKADATDVTQASGPLKRGEIPPPPGPAKADARARIDSYSCPVCKANAPATGGTKRYGSESQGTVIRYRECQRCGHTFKTKQVRSVDARGRTVQSSEEVSG